MCRLHSVAKSGEGNEMWSTLSSASSITRFATTTETGDPMAVPWTCWYIFPLNCRKVALRHGVRRSTISPTLRSVLSGRVGSFSSLRPATCTARSVGTQVNKDTTSKDTITSSSVRVCLEMNSAKSLELCTYCPTTGVSRSARNLDSLYVGEDTNDTTCLPFVISSTPGIFQRVIESVLQGNTRLVAYLDDILMPGATKEEHLRTLEAVFDRLEKAGLRVCAEKCQFMVSSVTYLGYQIDAEGLHPLEDKVHAVVNAPSSKSVQELKAYLGLLTCYGKFLPDLSTKLARCTTSSKRISQWHWRKKQNKAFEASKQLLTSSCLLVHFNLELKLVLACDASAYGVGAILAHQMPDGLEQPIGYVFRTLTDTERNYSQLEIVALACIFGVQRYQSQLTN